MEKFKEKCKNHLRGCTYHTQTQQQPGMARDETHGVMVTLPDPHLDLLLVHLHAEVTLGPGPPPQVHQRQVLETQELS